MKLNSTNRKSPSANRWRKAINEMDKKEFAEMIIADAVDEAIYNFMDAVDNGLFNISYNSPDGKVVAVEGDIIGELAGWYMIDWRFDYSNERSIDDFPDL